MLLTGLEAELLSDLAPPEPEEMAGLPAGWDAPDERADGAESSAPVDAPPPAASIEAEIWEALQIEVGRSAGPAASDEGRYAPPLVRTWSAGCRLVPDIRAIGAGRLAAQ